MFGGAETDVGSPLTRNTVTLYKEFLQKPPPQLGCVVFTLIEHFFTFSFYFLLIFEELSK
jgi:hypothetical protein